MPTTTEDATGAMVKAAKERLKRATDKRDPQGLTGVTAGDVIAVCAALKPENADGVTGALLQGATGAGPAAEVWQKTEHLLHLLEKAG